jgi:Smg protein
MYQVLAFVYEHYWGGDACPELAALHHKLSSVGFKAGEVEAALLWLEDLKSATRQLHVRSHEPSTAAMRVFTESEQRHLGSVGWGFLTFLASVGTLARQELELVIERAMAAPGDPVSLEDLKLIVLMVFWGLGSEPDALMLNELCDDRQGRLAN